MTNNSLRIATINISNQPNQLSHRYQLLTHELASIDTDFILLQEVHDSQLMASFLSTIGFTSFSASKTSAALHRHDCVMIASKIDHHFLYQTSSFESSSQRCGLYVSSQVKSRRFVIATSHFAWGSNAEGIRLQQAEEVNRNAQHLTDNENYDAVIFGGDLNADENSRTVRYLQGVDLGSDSLSSTYWTDAYISGRGTKSDWPTSDQGHSTMGRETAKRFGIQRPEMLPKRRIDYLMSYGWRYGKIGCPISYHRFGDGKVELSDHFGIYADILI